MKNDATVINLVNDLQTKSLLKINNESLISETNENKHLEINWDYDGIEDWYFRLFKNSECIENLNESNFISLSVVDSKNKRKYIIKRTNDDDLILIFNSKVKKFIIY